MNARFARSGHSMVVLAILLAVCAGGPVFGQSPLGTVAKETEAKRKTAKPAGKVYTNDDLKGSPSPAAAGPAAASATPPATEPSPSGGDKGKAQDPAKDEAAWRDRAKAERDALAKAEAFASALQSQINGLYGEFTACQAPTQCNEVSARRQKAVSDLDGAKKEIESHKKAISDIQEEARKAGVPAGWVR